MNIIKTSVNTGNLIPLILKWKVKKKNRSDWEWFPLFHFLTDYRKRSIIDNKLPMRMFLSRKSKRDKPWPQVRRMQRRWPFFQRGTRFCRWCDVWRRWKDSSCRRCSSCWSPRPGYPPVWSENSHIIAWLRLNQLDQIQQCSEQRKSSYAKRAEVRPFARRQLLLLSFFVSRSDHWCHKNRR